MTDKKVMPASGGGAAKGKPDGVSGSPHSGGPGEVDGRSSGGESGGGAYPNPHSGEGSAKSGASGHGGQSEIAYHGADNPNATTRPRFSDADGEGNDQGSDTPVRQAHAVPAGGRTIEVIEDSGVAAAEATGKIATDAPYEAEQENPGAG